MKAFCLHLEDEDRGLDVTPEYLIAICIDEDLAKQRAIENGLDPATEWCRYGSEIIYAGRFFIVPMDIDFGQLPAREPDPYIELEPETPEPTPDLEELRAKQAEVVARTPEEEALGLL